jgi:ABC-type multidrug transport system fused ATPase/permease subunit/CRP-like cAMP-binding protein
MAAAAAKARKSLAGLGSEPDIGPPCIYLDDAFADPDDPARLVTEGSVVDDAAGEVWMVVSPEAPLEPPHRSLALMFGSGLASIDDVAPLVEGYGLHLADVPSTRPRLAAVALPALDDAEGELRSAMAVDYVRYLLDREDEATLRTLLATPRGKIETLYRELYGATSSAMEQAWRHEVAAGEPDVKASEFLRLSARYLRPYWRRQVEIFAYMLLSLAFIAAFPFVSRALFDTAIPSGEFSEVLTLLVVLGVAFAVSLVAGLRQAYQSAWVSGAVVRDIRQTMFERLQLLPSSWFNRYGQGDVLARMFSDVGAVQSGLSDTIGQGIFQVLTLVVSAIIMLTINLPLGLVVLAGAPLVGFVYKSMARGAQERSIALREDNSAVLTVAAENYTAIPVVKMFGLGGREGLRFRRASDRLFRAQRRLSLFGGLFGLSVNAIVTLLRLVVLGFGAWLIIEGRFTIGGLVAFLAIMGEVISPVTVLTSIGQDIQAATGALVRINEVLDAEPEPVREDAVELPRLASELKLSDVSFSYTPERRALDGIDAVIPVGSNVAFVGPSGSGKSTVLRLIMRMYEPEEGTISIDGIAVADATIDSLRGQIGVVFQDPFLFDTTIRENIELGKPGATEDEILAAAAAAEIDKFIDALPQGYDTLVGERGSNLSGGQRQRVSIARALIRDPRILLLDEATSALDPGTERQISATLRKVGADRTVVAITHRLTSITDYDAIFVIDNGRLVEYGTHEELVALGGTYGHLWAEQTGTERRELAPFDAAGALARTVLFRSLGRAALDDISAHLRSFIVQPGDSIGDESGGMVIVRAGRGEVVSPSELGESLLSGELRPGDAFGVNALIGRESGARLRAVEPLTLLELDNAVLDGIARQHPAVAAALSGTADTTTSGPSHGHRLANANFASAASTRTTNTIGNPAP